MKKENASYFQGVVLVLLSALMFGITPVIGKLSYENGCNSVMPASLTIYGRRCTGAVNGGGEQNKKESP